MEDPKRTRFSRTTRLRVPEADLHVTSREGPSTEIVGVSRSKNPFRVWISKPETLLLWVLGPSGEVFMFVVWFLPELPAAAL